MTSSLAPSRPTGRRWTIEEFDRMGEAGVVGPEEKLELIEGEVFENVSPQSSRHSAAILLVEEALRRVFPSHYSVRVQMPLELDRRNKPEPDVAVVAGSIRDYVDRQPTTATLVVEVADTSLQFDRTTKASVYASAGIAEYWIINLEESVLEVYRLPDALNAERTEHRYRSVLRLTGTDSLSPLAAPEHTITVSSLLP